ncbi:hypothetical protein B0H17DRAFT_1130394 [Mycena rosella]|uniref:Uncharacterized protein n=1 Tax=Mycena rosella TaxID=1033263 RepID=A0AAD7GNJ1_MYCRO|nr:hypothetical protein B0H17DRAFT_1130394 [Mycena rosella]
MSISGITQKAVGLPISRPVPIYFSSHNVDAQFGILYPGMPRTNLNQWAVCGHSHNRSSAEPCGFHAEVEPLHTRSQFKSLNSSWPYARLAASSPNPDSCAMLSTGAYIRRAMSPLVPREQVSLGEDTAVMTVGHLYTTRFLSRILFVLRVDRESSHTVTEAMCFRALLLRD